ncbi:alpha/beta hydrolase [Streptomyces sp. NPDC051976]|uniref:alpha/beta fold hydrolase n=1 Tax=Streptomyces sp. NPDC051976 TaxID=3154947 RepID=UPI00343D2FB1
MSTFQAPDGTRLRFHVLGTGDPLLVVPGGPMSASEYLGDLGGLAAHRQLVLLDLRGTGGSEAPADPSSYRCDRQVPDVEALREHLGLERVDVLAHSAGANLAILYAAAHPGRIRTLTLAAPSLRALGVHFTEEHRREASALRADEPWYPEAAAALESAFAGTATREDWDALEPFVYGRWDDAAQAHAASGERWRNDEAGEVYYDPRAFDPVAAKAALRSLDAPVLLIAGERDGGPRPQVAAAAAAFFPGGRTAVQPGGAHYPWLDDPRWFVDTMTDFLTAAAFAR